MSSEPLNHTASVAAERRPAVWPWLLVPLLALALFFALYKFKEARLPSPSDNDAPLAEEAAPPAEAP